MRERKVCYVDLAGWKESVWSLEFNSWKNESSSYQKIPAHLPSKYIDKMRLHKSHPSYIDWIYVNRMDFLWICGTSLHVAHSF